MKENNNLTKLEFLLTCNQNIVVQRFFNVRNFNKNAIKSEELYNYIKRLCDELKYDLKMKSVVYMLDNEYEIIQNPEVLNTSYTDDDEIFNIYIKTENMTICHRVFDAKLYPPKVRYTVDLRPKLKEILNSLTDIFSDTKFNYFYPDFN